VGKRREGINVYFDVDYLKINSANKPEFDFRLVPHVQDNPRMGKAPEPATRHYLNRDIYTHVTYADLNVDTTKNKNDKFTSAKNYIGHVGDTIFSSNAIIVIDSLRSDVSQEDYQKDDTHLQVTAVLRCIDAQSKVYYARPKYVIQNNVVIPKEDLIEALGLKLVFWKINPDSGTIEITLSERLSNSKDFIVMEAYVFPYINILWLGCLIMAFGTVLAVIERLRVNRVKTS
jgi:cytochrome c-type biogenesis protein CcmF